MSATVTMRLLQAGVYRLTHPMAERFATLWARADPDHTLLLPVTDVISIVAQLPARLGSAPEEGKGAGAASNTAAASAPSSASSAAAPGGGAGGQPGGPTGGSGDASVAGPISTPALVAAERIVHSLPLIPDDHHRLQYHAVLQCLADRASTAPPLGEAIDLVVTSGYTRSNDKAAPLREVAAARMLQIAWRAHRRRRQRREEQLHAAAAAELQAHVVDSDSDHTSEDEDDAGSTKPTAAPPPYLSQRLLTPKLTAQRLRLPSVNMVDVTGSPGAAVADRVSRPSVVNAVTGVEDIPLSPGASLPAMERRGFHDDAAAGDDGRGLRTRLPSGTRFAPLPSAAETVIAVDGEVGSDADSSAVRPAESATGAV